MLVHKWLEDGARDRPDAPALVDRSGVVSYRALDHLANQSAHVLAAHGLTRGGRVVVALDNGADMVAAYFGVLKAGGVAVPLPSGARSDRLTTAIADCSPDIVLVDPGAAAAFGPRGAFATVGHVFGLGAGVRPADIGDFSALRAGAPVTTLASGVLEDDLAAIVYTSGTTGVPRGVQLSHANFVANARSIVAYLNLTANDRVMCVLPFSYVYGLSLLHTHLAVGGSVVIENRAAFPNAVLKAMADHAVTGFSGVPSTFALMLHRSDLDATTLPSLRYVTQAGGAMAPAMIDEWLRRAPRAKFFVMYGATEAAARVTYLPPEHLAAKRGSIGRAIPDVEVRVLDDAGRVLGPGEVGELVVRGRNVSRGYWNRPDETRERFGPDGYRTGDLGYADADGYLFITGRRHDMIKVGANRVGAREIENVLYEHPAVHEAAVVGVADDLLGEVPEAMVALRHDVPEAERLLRAFAADRLAPYKVPARVRIVAELPKLGTTGKIDRETVRRQLAAEVSRS